MEFIVSEDKMRAYVVLNPSEIATPYEKIVEAAKEKGIHFGILSALGEQRKTGTPLLLAEGKVASPDETAAPLEVIIKPKPLPRWQDAVSWTEEVVLDKPVTVKRGAELAIIQEAKAASAKNVLGETIFMKSAPAEIPFGEGVAIKDGRAFAAMDGHLTIRNEKVIIEPLLVVEGDVGKITGNIRFPGMVLVHGNIQSRLEVQAKRNIVVMGTVEGSHLHSAQGSIFVRGGVKGSREATLEAREDIYCKFAEFSQLKAKEVCALEVLFHSEVSATEALHLLQGRGAIVGGSVQVGKGLFAKVVGSRSFVYTEICVATAQQQEIVDQLSDLEKQLESKRRLMRKWGFGTRRKQISKAAQERIADLKDEMKGLQEELEKTITETKVEIEDRIYPGTLLRFLGEDLELEEEKERVSIRKPSFFSPVVFESIDSPG